MYVEVLTIPGAKKEKVEAVSDKRWRLSVKEPAERNLANVRVVEIIAEAYNVSRGKVHIVTGHHSRKKVLDVDVD